MHNNLNVVIASKLNIKTFAIYAAVGAAVLAVLVSPVFGGGLVGGAFALFAWQFAPRYLLLAAVGSLAVGSQYVIPGGIAGLETSSVHNLFLITVVGVLFIRSRHLPRMNAVIVAYAIILLMTYTASTWHPGLTLLQPVESFCALTLGPLAYHLRLDERTRRQLMRVTAALPIISVAVGLLLHATGSYQFFRMEFTGAFRLQGATIPAHLAMLGVVGMMATPIVCRSRSAAFALLGLDFLVIVLTGTRGAMISGVLLMGGYFLYEFHGVIRGHIMPVLRSALLALVAAAGLYMYLPQLLLRINANQTEAGINTSGRLMAWAFFWSEAKSNLIFGRGLGAATVANQGAVHSAFRVPHNEYLRLIVESGFVGLVVVVVAYLKVIDHVRRSALFEDRTIVVSAVLAFGIIAFVDNPISTPLFLLPFWLILSSVRQRALTAGADEQMGLRLRRGALR